MLRRKNIPCFQFAHKEMGVGIKHPLLIGQKMVTGPFPQHTPGTMAAMTLAIETVPFPVTILGEYRAGTEGTPGGPC